MSAPQSEAFKTAAADSKKLTSKPNNEELLELYGTPNSATMSRIFRFKLDVLTVVCLGLYKVGCGEDITKAPSPGMFDLKVRKMSTPYVQLRALDPC